MNQIEKEHAKLTRLVMYLEHRLEWGRAEVEKLEKQVLDALKARETDTAMSNAIVLQIHQSSVETIENALKVIED